VPEIWDVKRKPRRGVREPRKLGASVAWMKGVRVWGGGGKGRRTAGLNKPPLMRKNTQTFTIRLKPKQSAIYNSVAGLSTQTN
jgi:hypothetical protein